jgi:anti-anti-sigma regulatory factor
VIKFEVDQARNLAVIHYSGVVRSAETEEGLLQIQSGLTKLKSGFRVLVDLTELQSMDVACAPLIEKAMDLCNAKGVETIIRVIPDPHRDIGLNIMSIFHYGSDVRIVTCQTLNEATALLRD